MKNFKIFAILVTLLTVLLLTGCEKPEVKESKEQTVSLQKPYRFDSTETLVVGSCEEIFSELKAKNPSVDDAELYSAASLILFNAKKTEEGNLCCDNITDETLKNSCKTNNS
ncbi:MAG: hypothetical protein WC285_03030 [Candidatus Gracilibacteria bacterium]|jgi:hypothetical protein